MCKTADIGRKSLLQLVEKRWSEREVLQVIDVLRKTKDYLPSVCLEDQKGGLGILIRSSSRTIIRENFKTEHWRFC